MVVGYFGLPALLISTSNLLNHSYLVGTKEDDCES